MNVHAQTAPLNTSGAGGSVPVPVRQMRMASTGTDIGFAQTSHAHFAGTFERG